MREGEQHYSITTYKFVAKHNKYCEQWVYNLHSNSRRIPLPYKHSYVPLNRHLLEVSDTILHYHARAAGMFTGINPFKQMHDAKVR